MNIEMENMEKIDADIKKLLDNIENVKLTVDLFGSLVDKKLTVASV